MSISKHQKRFSNLPNFLLHFRKPACWADVPNCRRTGWFPHHLLYWSVVCSISVLGSVQIFTEEAMWTQLTTNSVFHFRLDYLCSWEYNPVKTTLSWMHAIKICPGTWSLGFPLAHLQSEETTPWTVWYHCCTADSEPPLRRARFYQSVHLAKHYWNDNTLIVLKLWLRKLQRPE